MKNFLAIDTSNETLTVLAAKNGRVFSSFVPDCAMKHSVRLMGEIDALLKEADLRLEECDFFCAVVGPGSFTGIRIGVSAAKGFCLACGKPSIAVTSFELSAYNAVEEKALCLVDAMHNSYYACGYDKGVETVAPCYLTEEEVLAYAAQGYALYATSPVAVFERAAGTVVSACEGLKKAALDKSKKGECSPLSALYVRKSSAEMNLKK